MIEKFKTNFAAIALSENDQAGIIHANCPIPHFSFLDDFSDTFYLLSNISAAIAESENQMVEISFPANSDGSIRYCNDVAPFMLLDKMTKSSGSKLHVSFEGQNSLEKVLCAIHLKCNDENCVCFDKNHNEVFPVPVMWFEPSEVGDYEQKCQCFITNAAIMFADELEKASQEIEIEGASLDEILSLESHLWELLGNCYHARNGDSLSGELGFSSYLALREGKLYINISVITFGNSIRETFSHIPSTVQQMSDTTEDVSVFESDETKLADVLAINDVVTNGRSSKRGDKSGGLFKFFLAIKQMSTDYHATLMSGSGSLVQSSTEGENFYILPAHTPGTVITTRFKVDSVA